MEHSLPSADMNAQSVSKLRNSKTESDKKGPISSKGSEFEKTMADQKAGINIVKEPSVAIQDQNETQRESFLPKLKQMAAEKPERKKLDAKRKSNKPG